MSAKRDPYVPRCSYTEESRQFGEPFECTKAINHSGSHYDEFLDQWEPMGDRAEPRCPYWFPMSEFTVFQCELGSGHVGGHYDSSLDKCQPNGEEVK